VQRVAGYDEPSLKAALKSDENSVRFAAAYVAGEKKTPLVKELIDLLADRNLVVQQAARRSLILLGCHATVPDAPCRQVASQVERLIKLGPKPTVNKKAVSTAAQRWKDWWAKNDPDMLSIQASTKTDDAEFQAQAPAGKAPRGERGRQTTNPVAKTPGGPSQGEAERAEQTAARRLELAKGVAEEGLEDKAREWYAEIVRLYPGTRAADEARRLLEKLKK